MLISQEICHQLTDQEIIRKSIADIDYFSCLYDRYEERLLLYIMRISKFTRQEAEDILQDAYIKVWKNLHAINPDLKISSWLYRLVHNEVISHWRVDHRTKDQMISHLNEHILENLSADMDLPTPNEEIINEGLRNIPEKYRQVLVLKYFEEMSYEEISDILKIPEGTVAIRLNRAKLALEARIKKIKSTK